MYEAIKRDCLNPKVQNGNIRRDAHKMYRTLQHMTNMMGNKVTVHAITYALAVSEQNACMGE